MTWDQLLAAVLTGTVIGAGVTGIFTLLKPLIDYWVSTWTRRQDTAAQRRKVVETVVERLRKQRIAHQKDVRGDASFPYDLVLETSDSALLIHDQDFARYLSLDIENAAGFRTLADWSLQSGDLDDDAATAARAARWDHLKTLVARASQFAVTGKWDKKWMVQAEALEKDIAQADAALYST